MVVAGNGRTPGSNGPLPDTNSLDTSIQTLRRSVDGPVVPEKRLSLPKSLLVNLNVCLPLPRTLPRTLPGPLPRPLPRPFPRPRSRPGPLSLLSPPSGPPHRCYQNRSCHPDYPFLDSQVAQKQWATKYLKIDHN